MAPPAQDRGATPSPSRLPLPGSPTYSYASTANPLSSFNLPVPPPPRPMDTFLTKADLEHSHAAYSELLATAKSYRSALAALSQSSSAFGSALESCARLKESRADSLLNLPPGTPAVQMSSSYSMRATSCTADHLLSASGVHHLIANHQQILSETVYRSFEVPLLHDLDKWKTDIEDAEAVYQKEVAARSKEIRRLEKEGLKLHKQRRRDLGKFREHLVQLTGKLDGLSELHGNHAQGMLRDSQEASMKILEASCSLVRAEVDIFESLARKGWSGGGLDDLLEKGRDLFAADEEGPGTATAGSEQAKLFSILPPKSILADTASDSGGRGRQGAHKRSDSLLGEGDRYQSLAGAVTITGDVDGDADADSIFSEVNHRSGVRPFSPQPIRRVPTDVVMDPENLLEGVEEPTHQQTDSETEKGDGDEDEDEDDGTGTLRPRRPRHGESRPRVDERQPNPGADDADSDTEDRESPWKDEGLRQASSSTENP